MNATKLRFGEFELDVAAYELTRSGQSVKLERIPMDLLILLADRGGELVTREEILEKLWGKDVFLDANNSINTAISKIRTALGDEAFIKTVPGKGYRFAAPVIRPTTAPRRVRRWLWPAIAAVIVAAALGGWSLLASRPAVHSLAVLPLENLTGDPSQEYFADGMTDELITDLAQIGSLRVISRTSIMRYKGVRKPLPQIARELNVDGIVEGTVTRSSGRIRITSQLIHAASDRHLWAHSYERDLGDVVALQGEVAEAIAGEVKAALTPEQRTRLSSKPAVNPAAYDAYLRGRFYWNQRNGKALKKSIEFFQQAAEKDPNFALAYAGLADAYNFANVLGMMSPRESVPEARAAALKALVLDPQLAEAHAALGVVKSHYDFDFAGARREFLKAIELNPGYANAHLFYSGAYLTPMRRHSDAIAEMKKAVEVDPLSLPLNNMLATTYMWAGRYDESVHYFEHTLELDPRFPLSHVHFSELLQELGRYSDAIRERRRGEELFGVPAGESDAVELGKAFRAGGPPAYWKKNLELTLKDQKSAGARFYPSYVVAGAYARAGNRDEALAWLERAYENREGEDVTLIASLPEFKSLRGDPRFAALLGRMGLPH